MEIGHIEFLQQKEKVQKLLLALSYFEISFWF